MPHIICLAGPAGPEKTALINGLAALLADRGIAVGLVRLGGAEPAPAVAEMTLGPDHVSVTKKEEPGQPLEILAGRYLEGVDLVISEAHQGIKKAKLEYVPQGATPELLADPGLKAIVSESPRPEWPRCFAPGDLAALADFLCEQVIPQKEPARVRINLGGKNLPIKDFVQDIAANTIMGFIRSLRGGERQGRVVVVIEPVDDQKP